MNRAVEISQDALGFFTVLQHEQFGLVGGYLILNAAGRPLEFHCTAPVKSNRAQQILFGPTLDAYLYGEQIGQTLLAKGSLKPRAVFTNVERGLAVRDFVALPTALVLASPASPQQSEANTGVQWHAEVTSRAGSDLIEFELGQNRLAVATSRETDRDALLAITPELTVFDLAEPFQRICEAVEEAHKITRTAA